MKPIRPVKSLEEAQRFFGKRIERGLITGAGEDHFLVETKVSFVDAARETAGIEMDVVELKLIPGTVTPGPDCLIKLYTPLSEVVGYYLGNSMFAQIGETTQRKVDMTTSHYIVIQDT